LTLVKIFRLEALRAKTLLALLLFLLPVSYILSSILAHYVENGFSRFLYFATGLWLGLLTTLVVAFFFSWIIFALTSLIGWKIGMNLIGSVALALAIGYSTYGIWNAYHPEVKNITVELKNLPESWQGKKVVQISDVHLGHVLRKDFFAKIVKDINDQKPEAVFITGDLFDGMGDDFDYMVEELNAIEAPQGVYFITGNHETYFGLDKVSQIISKTKLKAFQDNMEKVNGLQIIGINFPERSSQKNVGEIIKNIPGYDPDGPSVLLFHSPTQIEAAKNAGVKLQLSGHTHRGQIYPFNLITHLVYHGYDYGLKTSGDYSIYTSCGAGVWGPTMRTDCKPEIVSITLR